MAKVEISSSDSLTGYLQDSKQSWIIHKVMKHVFSHLAKEVLTYFLEAKKKKKRKIDMCSLIHPSQVNYH